jgi:hypothetical protein
LDDFAVSGDGARLAYRTVQSLEIKPTGLDEVVGVHLDRIRVTVEPPAERTQRATLGRWWPRSPPGASSAGTCPGTRSR